MRNETYFHEKGWDGLVEENRCKHNERKTFLASSTKFNDSLTLDPACGLFTCLFVCISMHCTRVLQSDDTKRKENERNLVRPVRLQPDR